MNNVLHRMLNYFVAGKPMHRKRARAALRSTGPMFQTKSIAIKKPRHGFHDGASCFAGFVDLQHLVQVHHALGVCRNCNNLDPVLSKHLHHIDKTVKGDRLGNEGVYTQVVCFEDILFGF